MIDRFKGGTVHSFRYRRHLATKCLDSIGILCLIAVSACASLGASQSVCRVDVDVLTPFGDKLAGYELKSGRVDGLELSLEGENRLGVAMESFPPRIVFSRRFSPPLEVYVELDLPRTAQRGTGTARKARTAVFGKFEITECRQRVQILDGSEMNVTGWGLLVKGRLTGCSFQGDWWVRASPMFGSFPNAAQGGSYVEPDGGFHMTLPTRQRYVLTIGVGRQFVRAVPIDVNRDFSVDLAPIDMRLFCMSK